MTKIHVDVNEEGELTINNFTEKGFISYLRGTLIPDLIESGMEATAEDFRVALAFLQYKPNEKNKIMYERSKGGTAGTMFPPSS